MSLFSIVVPCYNGVFVMKRALQSLEQQNFLDFEVVLVDDCSTDDTYRQLQKWKKRSTLSVKLLKQEKNQGPGPSRNHAMTAASGTYLMFLDMDDYLREDALEQLAEIVQKEPQDLVLFDYAYEKDGKISAAAMVRHAHPGAISVSEAMVQTVGSSCGKLYRREILVKNHLVFPPLTQSEDMAFFLMSIVHCKKVYYRKETLYYYVQHTASLTHQVDYQMQENDKKAFCYARKRIGKQYEKEMTQIFCRECLYSSASALVMQKKTSRAVLKSLYRMTKYYPDWYNIARQTDFPIQIQAVLWCIRYRLVWPIRILVAAKEYLRTIVR